MVISKFTLGYGRLQDPRQSAVPCKLIMRKLIILALLLLTEVASAAVSTGYYRVKSYNGKYLTENNKSHILVCSDQATPDNFAQVWYLDISGSNVTLKNALTDRYVQKTTGSSWSEQYITGVSSNTFTLTELSGDDAGKITFTDKWNGGPHCDASLNVVLWLTDETKSKWTVEAVDIDVAALAAQRAALSEATASQLLTVFTDLSCSALKTDYTSSDVSNLPAATQELVSKIKNDSWATYDGWDKTEKTFRIADYKAYSNSEKWTTILGFGHTLGRLSNPTGIYTTAGDFLQVYVGDVPSGQSIALEIAGYGQGSGSVYTLHSGMNVVQAATSGNCFVYYEVDNTASGSAPFTALSNYADVTVHIEGGTVQGYFDLTKGDDDSDWPYFKANLMGKEMFCLKTKTLVFNLQTSALKHAVDEAEGGSKGKVVGMLNYWQSIQDMEDELFNRASIGGENYAYCNNVHSVTTVGNSGDGSLYASTYGIYFSPEQHDRLFNYDLFRLGGDNLWASAHELGHHRQAPINMVGNTEMSNNIYSNVAVYQQGRYTSRTASIKDVFNDYQDGISWPERVQRANNRVGDYNAHILHLNWSLYLFFHVNGNDPDFFPSLFDALRKHPMKKVSGSDQLTRADQDYLKYYVKCCEVSGYDLTDFFASYGFFMLPPEQSESKTNGDVTTKYYQSFKDYVDYNLGVTQTMIDAAKQQVANMSGLKKCNIVFIEDRVTAPLATYDGHSQGEVRTINPDAPVTAFGQVGELGQYTDFNAPCSSYSFNVSARGNVTMEGTGAVGFIAYDASGNIIGFYNTTTFALPSAAYDEKGLKAGYVIKVAAGDGTSAAAVYDSNVEVKEFPQTGVWYTFRTPNRDNRYTTSQGAGNIAVGSSVVDAPTDAMLWQFVPRADVREHFDIVNRDGSYLSPVPGEGNYLSTTSEAPGQGWKVEPASDKYIIYSGTTQLHQTNSGYNYKMLNYGYWYGSYNTSDDGCLFAIEPAAYDVKLNAVGDASYATLYLPFDVKTNPATEAYYITSVSSGYATLTPVDNGEIPAKTAVVLINDAKSEYATLTATTGLAQQVSRAGNLLKGTLTSMSLDLSDSSPNYSLGVLNGNIGFYKFDNNGTTTITLGANKAYLEVPASGSSVKGFTLGFDGTEDDINQIVNGKSANGTWLDLNGRRLHGVPAAKGVYIVGGKKVVVK